MSPLAVFFLGACFGAIVMLLWCYRRDYMRDAGDYLLDESDDQRGVR